MFLLLYINSFIHSSSIDFLIMADISDLPSHFYCTKPIDFGKTIDTNNLKDKSVVVTGGASGLGAGCVTSFAKARYAV